MTAPEDLADALVDAVGGAANIAAVEHCVTRLRFVLRDPARAHPATIKGLPGVVSVVRRAGQLQVVVGTEVADAFAAIEQLPGVTVLHDDQSPGLPPGSPRGSLWGRGLDLLTGTFQPLLWPLVGASLIQATLAVLVRLGWMSPDGTAYAVWSAAGQAPFTFLPILVATSAARKLGANPALGAALGAALLAESVTDLGPVGTEVSLLGLPLTVVDYSQSVFPALLAVVMLSILEHWLRRRLPSFLHMVVIPTVCLAVLVPLTLVLVGPIAGALSTALSDLVGWLWGLSPAIAGALMGGLWQVFVMFGVHWGFVPVILNDLTVQGSSPLTGPLVSAVLAQGAAAAAVALRTRNRELRSLAGAASLSAMVVGITEPAIYGVTLRLRRPFVYACIASAVGGSVAAVGRSAADSFIFPSLLALPAFTQVGSFPMQLAGTGISVVLAFALTWFVGFTDVPDSAPPADALQLPEPEVLPTPAPSTPSPASPTPTSPTPTSPPQAPPVRSSATPSSAALTSPAPPGNPPVSTASTLGARGGQSDAAQPEPRPRDEPSAPDGPTGGALDLGRGLVVAAPVTGEVVPLDSVADPIFARGLLGPGVAVRPADGWVRSPVDGVVTSVSRTRHAIGVTSDQGVDVLVHVGLDTVLLGGTGFEVAVATGAPVRVGQVLMHVDAATLGGRGVDLTSPIVVTNAAQFAAVRVVAGGPVAAGDPLLLVDLGPRPTPTPTPAES